MLLCPRMLSRKFALDFVVGVVIFPVVVYLRLIACKLSSYFFSFIISSNYKSTPIYNSCYL